MTLETFKKFCETNLPTEEQLSRLNNLQKDEVKRQERAKEQLKRNEKLLDKQSKVDKEIDKLDKYIKKYHLNRKVYKDKKVK